MLEAWLLDTYDIRLDGNPVEISSRAPRTLLAYLILNPDSAHPRDKLAGILWPKSEESNARSNLRHALWRLRKEIGDSHLVSDRNTIGLAPDSDLWTDVMTLQRELDDQPNADEMVDVISVYRGELLPGFYEDWVVLERERLQAVYERRMQTALYLLTEEERWEEVLKWGERWIAFGHVPEPGYRALMTAHDALGDTSAVAEVWQRCVQALDEEIGVSPSEESRHLYKELTAEEAVPSTSSPSTAEAPPEPPPFLQDQPEAERDERLFVGRERALAWLESHLRHALDDEARIAFVTGGPGRGKTALLRAFAKRAREFEPSLLIATGTCNAYSGSGDPYLPFREILTALTGDPERPWAAGHLTLEQARRLWETAPRATETLLETSPGLIGTVLAGEALLRRATSQAPPEASWPLKLEQTVQRQWAAHASAQPRQVHILDLVRQFLHALAAEVPLLLIIDDLQWADRTSTDLLFHLGRHLNDRPLMIVGAYRPEELSAPPGGQPHPLQGMINELRRSHGDITLDLTEEDRLEGRAFIEGWLDSESNQLGPAFREALHRHTGGHPLFSIELLRTMQARGELIQDEEGRWVPSEDLNWERMPARVEAVIEKRVRRLPAELRGMLSSASVEGEEFTVRVLARLEDLNERTVLRRLSRDLEQEHRLVRSHGQVKTPHGRLPQYRFTHHLFQRYLYDQLSAAERRLLHAEVGRILEELYQEDRGQIAAQLAYHFERAGDQNKARTYYAEAGFQAADSYAHQEAREHLLAALDLNPSRQERADLLARLGVVIGLEGRHKESIETVERAASIYLEMRDFARVAWCYAWMARFAWFTGHSPRQLHIAQQGVEALRDAPESAEVADLMHEAARAYYFNGDLDQAAAFCDRALDMAERIGAVAAEAEALNTRALVIANDRERIGEAIDLMRRSLELSRSHQLPHEEVRARNNLGIFLETFHGELEAGREHLLQSTEIVREMGYPGKVVFHGAGAASYAIQQGDLEQADNELEQIRQRAAELSPTSYPTYVLTSVELKLAHARGALEEALAGMSRLLGEAREQENLSLIRGTAIDMAEILIQQDRLEEAGRYLDEAINIIDRGVGPAGRARALKTLIRARKGEPEAAQELLKGNRSAVHADHAGLPLVHVLRAEAHLAAARAEWDRAWAKFDAAIGLLQEMGGRLWEARVLREWARLRLERGQEEDLREGQRLLERTRELFEAMGASNYVEAVDEQLAELEQTED